ncbi:Beta-mannosyltransferase 1 [Cladophialophora chaetospira]|uniref:Beta-mannosyltransferase 1 n=1 Tax=Cladophialophora chaetospira TaxID=386627 RepID=A0AA38XCZ1_9EURO|nr:Beta-mannosyltransferase 1 [Cladophialophora chaetospira]
MGVLPILDRFSAPARIQRLSVFALTTVLAVLFLENTFFPGSPVTNLHRRGDRSRSEHYQQWGAFEPMQIPGFVNTGLPGKRTCDSLKYNSTVGMQQSFHLTDDIHQIALALDHHPIVDYPDEMMNDPEMNTRDIVEKTWLRLAGSSVWLPQQKVYLSVTRVVFSPSRTRTMPKMSFLRGQLFSEEWEHLDNHTITWSGKRLTFPTVFDVPAQWDDDGGMFGPEDPRIILEQGVEDAEPLIIFNMVARKSGWKRAMYLYRPFSRASTILTIKDTERAYDEKDWAPFFIPEEEQQGLLGKIPLPVPGVVRKPSEYIHFVYSFGPLRVLKCHMRCGDCEFVYEQDVYTKVQGRHHDDVGTVRGGTNFVQVPIPSSMDINPRVRVYAAFPQTNIAKHCDGNSYRPEFAVMVNIGNQFQLAFASESLDFGNAILELGPDEDRCDKGRILIPNTVARWDTSGSQDVMTVTFSVNDETTQVARFQGLLALVRNLPQFKTLLKKDALFRGAEADLVSIMSSWVGDDVRGCLVESAANSTGTMLEDSDVIDEDQEMDLSAELMLKLKQQAKAEEERKKQKEKQKEAEAPKNKNPIGMMAEGDHPPADPGFMAHPIDTDLKAHPMDADIDAHPADPDIKGVPVDKDIKRIPQWVNLKDHPPAIEDFPLRPKLDGEFEDAEGSEGEDGTHLKQDDHQKEELKKDDLAEDTRGPGKEAGGGMNRFDNNGIAKLDHPPEVFEEEKKPDNAPKAGNNHGGHHRYHKAHDRRRARP